MIRPININLNAAHPELPLVEATTFTGAPSSVFIHGVPKSCGNWSITAVNVAVTYPDNSTTTRAAVESAEGVWVATIPGTATSGRTVAGFRILADGIDENGAAVTGYVLGFADFSVFSFLPVPAPGETYYLLRYFDAMPTTPKKGDVAVVGGVLKYYNGSVWEPFAALDDAVTRTSANGVKSSGIWSAIWGAATTGFTSLYDWCVSQLAGKASKSDVDPLLFAQYYPEGNVKSAAEFTAGIKYNAPDEANRTMTVRPFCSIRNSENDNSGLVGRVVIPPFVDASGNPYISDDGTRYKVVGVGGGSSYAATTNLTAIVVPRTVVSIGSAAFARCTSLSSVALPAVANVEANAFSGCTSLASVALPAATTIRRQSFYGCASLTSVDFGDTPRSSVPTLGVEAFVGVPTTCKIIVPYTQYDEWKAAVNWRYLPQEFVRHAEKADKPTTFTAGNLAALDEDGNPTDSQMPAANVAVKGNLPYSLGTPIIIDSSSVQTDTSDPQNPIDYAEVTLANRTVNAILVSVAVDELRVVIPAETNGKVRDFGLVVLVDTAIAAPALVPVAPTGESIMLFNSEGKMPELADGTVDDDGRSTLYFSEITPGSFLVEGEQIQEVA